MLGMAYCLRRGWTSTRCYNSCRRTQLHACHDRLKITQPALSKQIAELENRVGFLVFKRNQKRVELTEAGQVFVRGCSDALAILEKSVLLARSTHDEVQPLITVGHSPYVYPALISAVLSTHLPLYPYLRLRMESMFAMDFTNSVLAAELDLAIIAEPSENPHLTLVQLATVPLCVAMQADHPAAKRRSVSIEELGDVGWMIFPRKAHPVIYDPNPGRKPTSLRLTSGIASLCCASRGRPTHYVPENFVIPFVPKGVPDQIQNTEIAVRPLTAFQVTSYLVLRADQSSRLVNEFGGAFPRKVIPKCNIEG